jgi:hypothetical protein
MQTKADANDFLGRFREIVSDPLNLLIPRHHLAGIVEGGFVHLHNGNRVPISGPYAYYDNFSYILVINRGVHEPLEEYVFQNLLNVLSEKPSMLELGAYWGHYSMWLKKKYPEATVSLVEPGEVNIQAGQYNFHQNKFEGEFIQAFVGTGHFEVDRFFKARKLSKLDVLHSDIQGYEMEMLEGGTDTLRNHLIDYIFISTHSQDLHENVIKKLESFGYRIEVSADFDRETTSYDGFVFASSPSVKAVVGKFNYFGRERIADSQPVEIVNVLMETLRTGESGREKVALLNFEWVKRHGG